MKRFISVMLCFIILCTTVFAGVFSASAADDASNIKHYSIINSKTITIPDNQVRMYTSNLTASNCVGNVLLRRDDKIVVNAAVSESIGKCQTINTLKNKEYKIGVNFNGFSSITSDKYSFKETGGTYRWVKFSIYDFAGRDFNKDGTVTKKMSIDDAHTFNFTDEGNDCKSALMIISGAAITVTAPDKDGYVEAYISTNLGDNTEYMNAFMCGHWYGGGSRYNLNGMAVGDVLQDGYVRISDATEIQKYIADSVKFDSLSKRNADVNHDGKIDIEDVTAVQKCIAGLEF